MLPKISAGLPARFIDSFMTTALLKGLGDRARVQGRGLPPDLAFLVRKKRVVRGRVLVISLQPPQTREAL